MSCHYVWYWIAKTIDFHPFFPHSFVVDHKPQDSKLFLRTLVQVCVAADEFMKKNISFPKTYAGETWWTQEKQELCERVMVTRLHLYNKWIKVIFSSVPSNLFTKYIWNYCSNWCRNIWKKPSTEIFWGCNSIPGRNVHIQYHLWFLENTPNN